MVNRPHLFLTLALPLLAVAGAIALAQPALVDVDADVLRWYWARHYWQCAFDAISAVCGAGLLTHSVDGDYTAAGRWTLLGLGHAGALLYLAVITMALRRLQPADSAPRLPAWWVPLVAFVVVEALLIGLVYAAARATCETARLDETVWLVGSAFASLGWKIGPETGGTNLMLAFVGLIAGLGWPLWLAVAYPLGRRVMEVGRALRLCGGYLIVLAAAGLLVAILELPRGVTRGAVSGETLSLQEFSARLSRSVVQVVSAATAGIPTESLEPGQLRDSSRVVLAGVILMGGAGGSVGGGIKWPLLLWALTPLLISMRRRAWAPAHETTLRCVYAAGAMTLGFVLLTMLTAFGLLLIEGYTASAYQPPPTFAEALLDAASAVCGANLSSGLAATVTDPNLTSGMRQAANQYQYGMTWLMAAMLAGRLLPIWILVRVARMQPAAGKFPAAPLA